MKKLMDFLRADYAKLKWKWMFLRIAILSFIFLMVNVLVVGGELNYSRISYSEYQEELARLRHLATRSNYDRVSSIMDLSVEFHFDPTIVMLVDHYSRLNVNREEPAWSIVKDHEVMTHVALSLIKIESNGNTFATSNKKAYGLTQLLLPTARDYEPEVTKSQLFDQETNIRIFFMHFERLLEHYEGNMTKVLHGWNRGEGTVDRLLALNIDPSNGFSDAIYKVALTNNRMRMRF